MPPVTYYQKFVQAGEPYNCLEDPNDHKFKLTYTTEVEIENKKRDRVDLDDEDLKKSIDDGTFRKNIQ